MKSKRKVLGVELNEEQYANCIDFFYGKKGTYDKRKQAKKHKETCTKNRKKRKNKKR